MPDLLTHIDAIREDFPILSKTINKYPLVYFDNAASTQKPKVVIDTLSEYYKNSYSNIHRGVHHLSQIGTDLYEASRKKIQSFIGAKHAHEVVFTSGTTEAINLVAQSFCKKYVQKGDHIIITELEHHSNIVPWQMAAEHYGAIIKVVPIKPDGSLHLDVFKSLLTNKVKIVALNHISNTLGVVNPIKEIIDLSHQKNIPVLIDGAQAVAHGSVDVQDLDADFYCFSAHKLFGPTGVGVLYGKEKYLNAIPPYKGGGDMIKTVKFEQTTYNDLPFKFEAGTPNIAGVIAFKSAIEYVENIGFAFIQKQEDLLLNYATTALENIEGLTIYGTAKQKASVISFTVKGIHPYDLGTLLDQQGFALRTGKHCTEPLLDALGVDSTLRASFSFYNTIDEIDRFVTALNKCITILA